MKKTNTFISLILSISLTVLFLCLMPMTSHGLSVSYFNKFVQRNVLHHAQQNRVLSLVGMSFTAAPSDGTISIADPILRQTHVTMTAQPFALLRAPLVSPSPLRSSETASFGFGFSGSASLSVSFFDMRGNLLFTHAITKEALNHAATLAELDDFNGRFYELDLHLPTLAGRELPAGPYFFLLLQDQSVLSKGVFTVLPS